MKLRVTHAPGMPRGFPRHRLQRTPLVSDPSMRHARAVMHVGIANPWWRGKRSWHSRRMRNLQFNVSGKRPMADKMDMSEDTIYSPSVALEKHIHLAKYNRHHV